MGPQRRLLNRARGGDEAAYRRLVEPHRIELHAHCYRMLGSVHDAEDALQDVMLRAWRGLARFEGRSSLRGWLYRIATNVCIDIAAKRPKRVLPLDYGPPGDPHAGIGKPLAESVWVEPYPEARVELEGIGAPEARYAQLEAVELAFVVALQHLPATQRAVLILRDVLGFRAAEAAEALDTTVPAVKSALQRARKAIETKGLPEQTQQATVNLLGDARLREVVNAYVAAWERDDVDAVVSLLSEDATLAMPPTPTWYRGREAIGTFYSEWVLSGQLRWRHLTTRANEQPAIGCYSWDPLRDCFVATVLDVLTFRGAEIAAITAFVDPKLFATFGLPDELSGGP